MCMCGGILEVGLISALFGGGLLGKLLIKKRSDAYITGIALAKEGDDQVIKLTITQEEINWFGQMKKVVSERLMVQENLGANQAELKEWEKGKFTSFPDYFYAVNIAQKIQDGRLKIKQIWWSGRQNVMKVQLPKNYKIQHED